MTGPPSLYQPAHVLLTMPCHIQSCILSLVWAKHDKMTPYKEQRQKYISPVKMCHDPLIRTKCPENPKYTYYEVNYTSCAEQRQRKASGNE